MDLAAFGLTLRLAALTTALLLGLGTPLALWLASAPANHAGLWTRRAVQALVALPLVLPPTVLGFYLLMGMGPATALGRTVIRLLGHPLAFTFSGLLVGSMVYSLPFTVQPLAAAFAAVDPNLAAVAAVLGASPWAVFRRVILPLARGGFRTALVLTFAHTVGEFGVVLMLGGDIPGVTRTLSIAVFDQVQDLQYSAANRAALGLLAISFAALLVLYARAPVGLRSLTGRGHELA